MNKTREFARSTLIKQTYNKIAGNLSTQRHKLSVHYTNYSMYDS